MSRDQFMTGHVRLYVERETGIEPATFSSGSGIGDLLLTTYPASFEPDEPIESTISNAKKNLDQIWTKVLCSLSNAQA